VPEDGNAQALDAMAEVYEEREQCDWRGLGNIEASGVRFRKDYHHYDAELKFGLVQAQIQDPAICQCGDVVRGIIKPTQCAAYGKQCTPQTPLGALMVSSEGACSAYYQFDAAGISQ